MLQVYLRRTIFCLVFIPVFFYNWGCVQNTKYDVVKSIENRLIDEVVEVRSPAPQTTKYLLKLNPSPLKAGIRVDRVEAEFRYEEDEETDGLVLYMEPVSGSVRLFEVEVPRYSTVRFSVWLNPNKSLDGGSYCGQVQLYSDGLRADQTGEFVEEETILIAITPDNLRPNDSYCLYKRLAYDDL